MKIKLHETINSLGVLVSIGLGMYAAIGQYEGNREAATASAELVSTDQVRIFDGCAPAEARDHGAHKKAKYPWDAFGGVVGGEDCGDVLEPVKWRVTLSNLSREPLSIVEVDFVDSEHWPPGQVQKFKEPLGFYTSSPPYAVHVEVSLPLNISPSSSVALSVEHFVALDTSAGDAKICGVAKGAAEIETCLAWRRHLIGKKWPRFVSDSLAIEFVSATGRIFYASLPSPL